MEWTMYQIFLAVLMLTTGSINTLSAKWADVSMARGCNETLPARAFDHPFLQAAGMFIGELTCLLVFQILRRVWLARQAAYKPTSARVEQLVNGNQKFNPLIFFAPAMCDMVGTSLMYVGLNMTYASSFQMLRGSVIVFTALLSVAFLQRKIQLYMWLGIAFVVGGLAVVGASDFVLSNDSTTNTDLNRVITGDELIIMAQIIASVQMVLEERFVSKHNVSPMQAVGWEGFFGFVTLGLLLIPMYFIPVGSFSSNPGNRLEDVPDAFCQMSDNWVIPFATVGNIISIAFFNFAGVSVTRELSATTRMVLDSIRTLFVYVVSLGVGWQNFQYLQVIGFILLVFGTLMYNGMLNGLYNRIRGRALNDGEQKLVQ